MPTIAHSVRCQPWSRHPGCRGLRLGRERSSGSVLSGIFVIPAHATGTARGGKAGLQGVNRLSCFFVADRPRGRGLSWTCGRFGPTAGASSARQSGRRDSAATATGRAARKGDNEPVSTSMRNFPAIPVVRRRRGDPGQAVFVAGLQRLPHCADRNSFEQDFRVRSDSSSLVSAQRRCGSRSHPITKS